MNRRTATKMMALAAMTAGLLAGGTAMSSGETAYNYAFEKIEGGKLPLSEYKGKAVLVVNTASFCGFTPQYEALEELWKQYKGKGLIVLGVPANNFGAQEPGSNAEIKTFCESKYDIDFPMTEKVSVKGDDAHPFYKWVSASKGEPQWNFHKYLINTKGELVGAYPSKVSPRSKELTDAIDIALKK